MAEEAEFQRHFIKPEISLHECRSILCRNGEQYTDEEIKEIRSLLLKFVEVDFFFFNSVQAEKARKVIIISPEKNENKPPYRNAG